MRAISFASGRLPRGIENCPRRHEDVTPWFRKGIFRMDDNDIPSLRVARGLEDDAHSERQPERQSVGQNSQVA